MKKIGVFILAFVLIVSCMTFTVNMNGFTSNEKPIQPIDQVYADVEKPPVDGVDGNSIEFTKTANKESAGIGDTVTYSFYVKNNSSNLAMINIIDSMFYPSVINDEVIELDTGEFTTIEKDYEVHLGYYIEGEIVNIATAEIEYEVGEEVRTSSAIVEVLPPLIFTKHVDTDMARVGDTIHYTFTVENTTNREITNVTINDPLLNANGISEFNIGTLNPKQTFTTTDIEYEIKAEDIEDSKVKNVAIVEGKIDNEMPVSKSAIATLDILPVGSITINKVIEGEEEDLTEFTVRVEGVDNYSKDFTITSGGIITIPDLSLGTYTITEILGQMSDVYDPPKIIVGNDNVEYPNGKDIELNEEVKDVTVTVVNRKTPKGTITIEKEVEGQDQDSTKFKVSITGENSYLEDFISMGNPVAKELNVGTYTITEILDQIPSGYSFGKLMINDVEYSNGAEIELTEEVNEITVKVINTKNESPPPPSRNKAKIRIEKTVSPTTAKVGDEVEYILDVKNIGDYTLSDVTITDPILGELDDFKLGTLKKGESKVVNVSYKIPEGVTGQLKNTATVTGKRGVKTVSDTDSAVVSVTEALPNNPAIDIKKSVDKTMAVPGETIVYTFVVTNTGDVDLEKVEVTDPLFGDEWKYSIGNLEIGKQVTFTEAYTVSEDASGNLENVAMATGSHGAKTVSDLGKVSVEIQVPPDLPYTGGPIEPEMVMAGMGGIAILAGKIYGNKKNKK